MASRLKIPFLTRVNGGGVITFIGTKADQAVYWELWGYCFDTDVVCGACGFLKYERTRTDGTGLSANGYIAPKRWPVLRVGLRFKVGEVKVGQEINLWDKLTVRYA
jgi:hypothetical protein